MFPGVGQDRLIQCTTNMLPTASFIHTQIINIQSFHICHDIVVQILLENISYFAYTDSDLELSEDCPDDFMEKFISLLKKYPKALKAGFALRIDDLPECFVNRNDVIDWESQFWRHEVEPGVYDAPIDTTFAVYKPYFRGELIDMNSKYFRTGEPYTARHLPWYVDSANKSEEETYYVSHLQTMTHWSEKS